MKTDPVQFELKHSQWYIETVDSGNVEALQWLFDVGCPYIGGTADEEDLVLRVKENCMGSAGAHDRSLI